MEYEKVKVGEKFYSLGKDVIVDEELRKVKLIAERESGQC